MRRSFICLSIASFFGAFNDNALKVVTCLLALEWSKDPALSSRWVALAGASFVLPYLFFSMLAGSMADRFSKSRLFIGMQWAEVPLMMMAAWGLMQASIPTLVGVLFLTGAQSALFSPAKYGLLPEVFGQDRLAWVNGVLEGMIFAGILIGTLAGSFAVDAFGRYPVILGLGLITSALIGAAASLGIQRTNPADPAKPLRINPITDVWCEWKILRQNKLLSRCTAAIGYFWFLGALVQLNALGYARHDMAVGPKGTGVLLSALAVGVGTGSALGGKIAGKCIRLASVRVGIIGVAAFLILLPAVHASFAAALASFFLLGLCGGAYIVPLNTVIQARSPADDKGRVIATTNFFSFTGILLASGVLWLFGSLCAFTPSSLFLVLGLVTCLAAFLIWLLLPAQGVSSETPADRAPLTNPK